MTRLVQKRQGRINHPLQATLFFSALLVFIFTVIYRMVKSESFSNAIAILVESLLIVSFFIFLGILLAYLIYFIHERIRQGSRRQQAKPDPRTIEFAPDDEIESSPDSA
jgi:predicted PurR-regulated permease PerM